MLVKAYSDSQFEHKRTKIWLVWAVKLLEEMAETAEEVPSDYCVLLEYAKENLEKDN